MTCPACGSTTTETRGASRAIATGALESFTPSDARHGQVLGSLWGCQQCRHGFVADPPESAAAGDPYEDAVDPVSLREADGQMATAARALTAIEAIVGPGRLLDIGCWTGSFLVAAAARGWEPVGIEPSRWAVARARDRGMEVVEGELAGFEATPGSFRAIVATDVIEHLVDPGAAVGRIRELLEPGGVLYATVPDAGSVLARVLGRRWWSVLPMHLQYFTRASMTELLQRNGFEIVDLGTHPKAFTARYYAERVGTYQAHVGRALVRVLERVGRADQLIAPDLRDRMQVLAVKR